MPKPFTFTTLLDPDFLRDPRGRGLREDNAEIGDITTRRGETVMGGVSSANRDETLWDAPDHHDMQRATGRGAHSRDAHHPVPARE